MSEKYWQFGWQLISGCDKVSEGCKNCWSLEMEKRFGGDGKVRFHEERLGRPYKRKKPAIFALWNDCFHEDISFENIDKIMDIINICRQHTFLVLTKRPKRMYEYVQSRGTDFLHSNLWLGVTCENQEQADKRIPLLLDMPVAKKFISIEPMLQEINLSQHLDRAPGCVNWVIIGCESGRNRRPCNIEWVHRIVYQCKFPGTPVFIKQLNIDGKCEKDITKFPKELQIRQLPF